MSQIDFPKKSKHKSSLLTYDMQHICISVYAFKQFTNILTQIWLSIYDVQVFNEHY